jgi:hypothetical protein
MEMDNQTTFIQKYKIHIISAVVIFIVIVIISIVVFVIKNKSTDVHIKANRAINEDDTEETEETEEETEEEKTDRIAISQLSDDKGMGEAYSYGGGNTPGKANSFLCSRGGICFKGEGQPLIGAISYTYSYSKSNPKSYIEIEFSDINFYIYGQMAFYIYFNALLDEVSVKINLNQNLNINFYKYISKTIIYLNASGQNTTIEPYNNDYYSTFVNESNGPINITNLKIKFLM